MVMALGGMLGLMGVPIPGIEDGIALSAILLGAAVMFEIKPPLGVAAALVASFAIFHGHAMEQVTGAEHCLCFRLRGLSVPSQV